MLTGPCLKTFQHKGLRKCQKKKKILLQVSSCPVWKCNYISVSIRSSTVRCRKPDTSSLSSAKLAFGSVMSELLDSFSAGILPSPPPFFPPSTCQLPYRCCGVRRGLSPRRASREPCSSLPVAACHLHKPHPITSSLFLSLYFPFPSHCRCLFFFFFLKQAKRASRWPTRAGLWLAHTALNSLSLFYFLSFSIQGLSSCLFHLIPQSVSLHTLKRRPHFEVTEGDATNPAGKLCLIALLMPPLTLLCEVQETDRGVALLRRIWHIFLRSRDEISMLKDSSEFITAWILFSSFSPSTLFIDVEVNCWDLQMQVQLKTT